MTFTPTPGVNCAAGPVLTTVGAVCGTVAAVAGTTVDAFLGIPYAEDTGGDNRWTPPVAKPMMQGTFQATRFGPICPQDVEFGDPVLPQSEDCLSVNVWTPASFAPDSALPVMAFIYGGSFLRGSSALPVYDAAYLSASQGVVVVTFNYRVGVLGFLAGVHDLQGNYGLQDQQLALTWVQENIGHFGGDATRVMLFGESAGAMSVGLHLLSMPSSANLFAAALMESNPFGLPYKDLELATKFGADFEKLVNCIPEDSPESLKCMRGLPASEIVDQQENEALVKMELASHGLLGLLLWAPVLDGQLVTELPQVAAERGLPKPTLLGTNQNEGTLFIYFALQELGLDAVDDSTYQLALLALFGETAGAEVLAEYPAAPCDGDNAPTLAQITNDYLFFCSNRFVAKQGGPAPATPGCSRCPAYGYLFTQQSHFNIWPTFPQCAAPMVCHAAELPYVFNTATNIGESFTAEEQAVSNAMLAYWSGFSRPGNDPNTGGANRPSWPVFHDFTYLDLGTPIETVVDPPHHCDLWDSIGYDLKPEVFLPAP
jgi:carboxylesterase type B